MRCLAVGFFLATMLSHASMARAVIFQTQSTATQTIDSPAFGGPVQISAVGPQTFDIDPVAGTASVTSAFQGSDLPDPLNPGSFLTYDLYNTTTNGTVTSTMSGYDINFEVLFELEVTSGPLSGLTFETQQFATFFAPDVATLPFPAGISFSDPTPPDTLPIYVKADPTGSFPLGVPVGTTSGRTVAVNSVVPEPSSIGLLTAGGLFLGAQIARRRFRRRQ